MKKVILIVIIFMLTITSCKFKSKSKNEEEKKAKNFTELFDKYDKKEFNDCESFMKATDEMMEVYLETIDKAYNGDETAKKELEKFDKFFTQFDTQAEKFSVECPDLFDKWAEKNDKKIAEATDKLVKIYNTEYEYLDYDESIEEELQRQLDSLNTLLEKAMMDK
ncbi:MAG: hypothetical protein WHW07_05770 [Bacteroidales bacterium]|jgi:hypothetical protein|nr:hypothetical protein [Bacteroidales bacterium]HPD23558.1 hypothetical protein [Bacteroidales bacterium]HRS99136.1 hypothetical protein [Bacteroidales bacterium]HRT79746.1 hypothetical protein [Bacteroidales bacterium]